MIRRLGAVFSISLLVVAVQAGAQPRPVPLPTPAPSTVPSLRLPAGLEPHYLQREGAAPLPMRERIAKIRQRVAGSGESYVVSYTSALDRTPAQLAGLVVPANAAEVLRQAKMGEAQRLRDEVLKRTEIEKRKPPQFRVIAPKVPSFNVGSSRADWRAEGVVSPIRDQGGCYTCWAYSVIGILESAFLINGAKSVDASERAVVQCSGAASGGKGNCGTGGWMAPALDWLTRNGTADESGYPPYKPYPDQSTCAPFVVQYQASAWGTLDAYTVATIKDALVKHGPVSIGLIATESFMAYAGGVFNQTQFGDMIGLHAVVLVGWDETKQAYILRNSWGTDWGETAGGSERGYMYLKYGSSGLFHGTWVHAPPQLERVR